VDRVSSSPASFVLPVAAFVIAVFSVPVATPATAAAAIFALSGSLSYLAIKTAAIGSNLKQSDLDVVSNMTNGPFGLTLSALGAAIDGNRGLEKWGGIGAVLDIGVDSITSAGDIVESKKARDFLMPTSKIAYDYASLLLTTKGSSPENFLSSQLTESSPTLTAFVDDDVFIKNDISAQGRKARSDELGQQIATAQASAKASPGWAGQSPAQQASELDQIKRGMEQQAAALEQQIRGIDDAILAISRHQNQFERQLQLSRGSPASPLSREGSPSIQQHLNAGSATASPVTSPTQSAMTCQTGFDDTIAPDNGTSIAIPDDARSAADESDSTDPMQQPNLDQNVMP
jgi:hypothetical protein